MIPLCRNAEREQGLFSENPSSNTVFSDTLRTQCSYEFRVGHSNDGKHKRWSTAQACFDPAYRIAGVQHPSPPPIYSPSRNADGKPLARNLPRTEIWFLLYAQAAQIDGSRERGIILLARRSGSVEGGKDETAAPPAMREIVFMTRQYGLRPGAGVSAVAVKVVGQRDVVPDPLGGDLGRQRILRSCLVIVPGLY